MLRFIEALATKQLPSFQSCDELIDYYNEHLFKRSEIDDMRRSIHRCLTMLAKAEGVSVHPDDDDDE